RQPRQPEPEQPEQPEQPQRVDREKPAAASNATGPGGVDPRAASTPHTSSAAPDAGIADAAGPDVGSPDADAADEPPRAPGGMDTAAIRRAWPDILGWIFKHKRTTWTLLSEHATVHEFDGRRVVLGISTVGIANTFRHGPHADLVRQALIDVLGVDARVEGIPVPDARLSAPSGDSHPVVRPEDTSRGFHHQGPGDSGAGGADAGGRAASAYAASGAVAPSTAPAPAPAPESGDGGWASAPSASGSGPSWATEGAAGAPAIAVSPAPAGSLLARAKAEVAAEQPERTPEAHVADDSAARDDDEDIEAVGDVGRPVIERILGGKVIDEG
ncbi:MAG: DNA polymerase III subunit gamma and tau, partial [Pedococcus sp.]